MGIKGEPIQLTWQASTERVALLPGGKHAHISRHNIEIYYTTDGSDPRSSNTTKLYGGPIERTPGEMTIRAIGFELKDEFEVTGVNTFYVPQ